MHYADDEIFDEAVKLPTDGERVSLVHAMCQGDPAREARIQKLVNAYFRMQEPRESPFILDRPGQVYRELTAAQILHPGDTVGHYRLIQKIGEGATGIVYRAAQQEPISREVALKLLKPGMDSPRILARFALERRALIHLEHPGITRIYDAGKQDNGRPYFVMELVRDAVSITQYCRNHDIGIQERIELVIQLCEIIQHAHQRGFIHRDLKPANVLVENKKHPIPQLKVIDFGLAKIFDNDLRFTSITQVGERFGTPHYVSPEQALQDQESVDVRSDVYSVGVLLYELLAGVTPFFAYNERELQRGWVDPEFWQQPVTAPSKQTGAAEHGVMQKIPRELDWICLKALANQPTARYQSMAELSRDLENFLNGRPIEAVGPGWMYRFSKFVSRNRLMAVSGVTAAAMVAALIWFAVSSAQQASRAAFLYEKAQAAVVELSDENRRERGRTLAEQKNTETILHAFEVLRVLDRSVVQYVDSLLMSTNSDSSKDQSPTHIASIQAQVTLNPHSRLFVRGDWEWAADQLQSRLDNFSSAHRIHSRDVAALTTRPKSVTEQADDAYRVERETGIDDPLIAGRLRFQQVLLGEFYRSFDHHDPFIAEVLDNCGLYLVDLKNYSAAEIHLEKACEIWEFDNRFRLRSAQSRLFLAECVLMRSAYREAGEHLKRASEHLAAENSQSPGARALSDFLLKLQERTSPSP